MDKNSNNNIEAAGNKNKILAALYTYGKENAKIGIFPHARVDGDALGSALSLASVLQQLGAEVDVYVDEKTPRPLEFFPASESTIVYSDEIKIEEPLDLAIAIDNHDSYRLEKREPLYLAAQNHIVIDHHICKSKRQDYEYIDSKASSSAELIFQFIVALEEKSGKKLFNDNIATWLISGIMTDTGRFSYDNTTPRALRQTAWLLENFAVDLSTMTHELFERTTVTQLQIRGDIFSSMKLAANGRILIATVSREMMKKRGAVDDDLEYLSSDMREADGIDVSILLRETAAQDEVHASVRSNSCLDAAAYAKTFGGGGHVKAAGFSLTGVSLEEAEEMALEKAIEMLDQCEECQGFNQPNR